MSSRALLVLIALLAAATVGLAVFWQPAPPEGAAGGAAAFGDFTLQAADGPLDSRSLRGKLVLVYFGYTYCPDICPTSLSIIATALGQLTPEELARVQTVFISVDPERDTPARLKDYTAFFHPNIVGVTGTAEQVAATARLYGAAYMRQDVGSSAGYVVDHTSWTYLMAPDGRLVAKLPHATAAAQVTAEIRRWLAAFPSPKGAS